MPRVSILDPEVTQKPQISAAAKLLSDHYKYQRTWDYPNMEKDIAARCRETAQAGGIPMTRAESIRWLREQRVAKCQIPASAGGIQQR